MRAQPTEREWFEFKRGYADPEQMGEYISALSNSACLESRPYGYLIYGVDDTTHDVVGTPFNPYDSKGKGNQDLLGWLARSLTPNLDWEVKLVDHPKGRIVLFTIPAAHSQPVRFKSRAFIRVGSSKTDLLNYPEKERELWRRFDKTPFERNVAVEHLTDADVLAALHCPTYFDLLKIPLPENRSGILERLAADRIISRSETGRWDVTNMGAILLAKNLADFPGLQRKAVRVIHYGGSGRTDKSNERAGVRGYAAGFAGLVSYITALLPVNEVIGQALRQSVPMFPPPAVRELVANAVIHQDFYITGTGPMVEIFDNRIEITNPGEPLVDTDRFLDNPPRSRNEGIAAIMRRFGICEERGSGIDKVVQQVELFQLPAPMFQSLQGATRATLFGPRPFNRMDKEDRVRACYLHACLKYVTGDYLTNPSLRERFGISPGNSSIASRYIKEATESKFIRLFDETTSRRLMKYVPFWA